MTNRETKCIECEWGSFPIPKKEAYICSVCGMSFCKLCGKYEGEVVLADKNNDRSKVISCKYCNLGETAMFEIALEKLGMEKDDFVRMLYKEKRAHRADGWWKK